MNLNLLEAFEKFGARPSNRIRSLSAIAADGALVLNCSYLRFGHPARGVLRYEDRLSRDAAVPTDRSVLAQHLTLARDGELPVRMVVAPRVEADGARRQRFHVRPDLVGKLVKFDGDHFVIDFTRVAAPRGEKIKRSR